MQTGTLDFLSTEGNVIASTSLPDAVFEEGEHLSSKQFSVHTTAQAEGAISRYAVTSPAGDLVLKGEVKEGDGSGPGAFFLKRLGVQPGDVVKGTLTVTTVKDGE